MRLRKRGHWVTADGRFIKYEEIEDDHLRNIIKKSLRNDKEVPIGIKEEYKKRGLSPKYSQLKKGIVKSSTYEEMQKRIEILEERLERLEKMQEL